jgi:hypothetical protein
MYIYSYIQDSHSDTGGVFLSMAEDLNYGSPDYITYRPNSTPTLHECANDISQQCSASSSGFHQSFQNKLLMAGARRNLQSQFKSTSHEELNDSLTPPPTYITPQHVYFMSNPVEEALANHQLSKMTQKRIQEKKEWHSQLLQAWNQEHQNMSDVKVGLYDCHILCIHILIAGSKNIIDAGERKSTPVVQWSSSAPQTHDACKTSYCTCRGEAREWVGATLEFTIWLSAIWQICLEE